MKKSDEVTNPNSCFNKAKDDELVFVLLARDRAAPHAIREWIRARVYYQKNRESDEQLKGAWQIAEEMDKRWGEPDLGIIGGEIDKDNLVRHARTELERAKLFDKESDYEGMIGEAVMKMIRVFAAEGHSGFSAGITLQVFNRVARFKTLTPITSDSSEWMDVGDGMWQNTRQSSCFSKDGGASYYDIDAPGGDRTPLTPEQHAARAQEGRPATGKRGWVNADVLAMAQEIQGQALRIRDEDPSAEERRALLYRAAGDLLSAMARLEQLSKYKYRTIHVGDIEIRQAG